MRRPRAYVPIHRRGFTLVELMVALAVAGILVTVAVPSFTDFVANQRVKAANQELFATLSYARSEAVRRNATVRVLPIDATEGWSSGWQVVDAADDLLRITEAPSLAAIVVDSAVDEIEFQRNGRVGTGAGATFATCDQAKRAKVRTVALDASGRPQTQPPGSKCT